MFGSSCRGSRCWSALLIGGAIISSSCVKSVVAQVAPPPEFEDIAVESITPDEGAALFDALPSIDRPVFLRNEGQWEEERVAFAAFSDLDVIASERDGVRLIRRDERGATVASVFVEFLGASDTARIEGVEPDAAKHHFFIGDKGARHRAGVESFDAVRYAGLYEGVDLLVRPDDAGGVKYEFTVAPGADASAIAWRLDGASAPRIEASGDLVFDTPAGPMRDAAPVAWTIDPSTDAREAVPVAYTLDTATGRVGFEVRGAYDRARSLVIDPDLEWMRYLGGSRAERGRSVAMTPEGDAVITGRTGSRDLPGAMNEHHGGAFDAFVVKVDRRGELVWATYLGGQGVDRGRGVVVDPLDGSIYVVGPTDSTDLPRSQNHPGGGQDSYIAKLAADGTDPLTLYLGGRGVDSVRQVAIGPEAIYVAGFTMSDDLPSMRGTLKGDYDIVVMRLDRGVRIRWSVVLGGSGVDRGRGIFVDGEDVFVHGVTASPDFEEMDNAYRGGVEDAFIGRLNGSGVLQSLRFYGGSGRDQGYAVIVDPDTGDLMMTGRSSSHDFEMANNAYLGGEYDGYLVRADRDGNVIWTTYLGGLDWEDGFSVAARRSTGGFLVSGATASRNMVGRVNRLVGLGAGIWDASLTEVGADGVIRWSMFAGGTDYDYAYGLALDDAANFAYLSGSTGSGDFRGRINERRGQDYDAWAGGVRLPTRDDLLMTFRGQCPGDLYINMTGATPGGEVAIVMADALGSVRIDRGACEGTPLGLARRNIRLISVETADANGEVFIPAPGMILPWCARYVQAVDLGSCRVSNVMFLE
ncbi:MAG: SBBP repeat-containing protein [Phycisphaerales bacterium]